MKRLPVKLATDDYWRHQIKCQEGCPVHTDSRGYVRAIAQGRYEDAYLIARGPNPLASICGRVCGAPCEMVCRRSNIDQAISIRALKRFVTDRLGGQADPHNGQPSHLIPRLLEHTARREFSGREELASFAELLADSKLPDNAEGEKVAIIGSGPAGLAAAHDLALMGFRPTVFEMEPVPAGMLAVGIPKYRLPNDLIEAEVEFIRAMGVEFVCNTQVGRDISLAEIRSSHLATIIAIGLKRSRILDIPGTHGKRVYGGVEMLRDAALGRPIDLQGRVVVIGGGNVAFDVARTVIRQTGIDISRTALRHPKVRTVHLCSLESLEELPADDQEILEANEEGLIRHHRVGPKEILLDHQGCSKAVVFQRCLRVFDEQGHFSPQFDEEDVTTIDADTVLWSIGQRPDLGFLEGADDIDMTPRGLPVCDPESMRTTAPDVFLAGDIAYGPKLLIHAVASGKQVAREIFNFARGTKLVEQHALSHEPLRYYRRERDYEKLPREVVPIRGAQERLRGTGAIVELGYGEQQAICEGCRCLDCDVNTIFDSSKCILCGGCADVCPELCLQLVSLDRLDGGEDLQRVLNHHAGDVAREFSAIVKDETKCIRCGLCADRCPTTAITMERMHWTSRWTVRSSDSANTKATTT